MKRLPMKKINLNRLFFFKNRFESMKSILYFDRLELKLYYL